MIWRGRLSKRFHVATAALRRQPEAIELPNGANLMARIAVHHRMRSDQREAVLMLINVVNGNLPSIRVVAKLALRAIFPAMQVRMAVLTFFWHMAEVQIRMAIDTLHFRVPPA